MSTNISFYEETGKLKIDITISCLTSIAMICVRVFFLFITLYFFCMGLASLALLIGIAIGAFSNDVLSGDLPWLLYFLVGIFFFCVGTLGIITLIGDIRYLLLRRTRASLEINDRIVKFSWSELKNRYKLFFTQDVE